MRNLRGVFGGNPVTSARWGVVTLIIVLVTPLVRVDAIAFENRIMKVKADR